MFELIQICRVCIENALYRAERKVEDGEFDKDYGRTWFEEIKVFIERILSIEVPIVFDPKPELLNRLSRSVQVRAKDSTPPIEGQFGFLRYLFYVLSSVPNICEFNEDGEVVIYLSLDGYTYALEALKPVLNSETQCDEIFQEFYGIAELNFKINKAASYFIADTCSELVRYTSNQENVRGIGIDFWLMSRKSMVLKKKLDQIITECKGIDMTVLDNNRRGEVFELLAKSYEEKKILTLAIERAKSAKENYSSPKRKEEISVYIKSLEDKEVSTRTSKKPLANSSNNATVIEPQNIEIVQDSFSVAKESVVFDAYIEHVLERLEAQLKSGNFQMSDVNQMTKEINDYFDKRKDSSDNWQEIKLLLNGRLCMFINLKDLPVDDIQYIMSVVRFYTNVLLLIDTSCIWDTDDLENHGVRVLTNLSDILITCYINLRDHELSSQMIQEIVDFRTRAFELEYFPACHFVAEQLDMLLQNIPASDVKSNLLTENLIVLMKCIDIQKYPDRILQLCKETSLNIRSETHRATILELQSKAYHHKQIYSLAIEKAKQAQETFVNDEDKTRMLQNIELFQSLEEEKERRQQLVNQEETRIPYDEDAEEEYFDSLEFFQNEEGDDDDIFNFVEAKIICSKFDSECAQIFERRVSSIIFNLFDKRPGRVHLMMRITRGIGELLEQCEFDDTVFISCLRYLFYGLKAMGIIYSDEKGGKYVRVYACAFDLFKSGIAGLLVQKVMHEEKLSSTSLAKSMIKFCNEMILITNSLLKSDNEDDVAACFGICKELVTLVECVQGGGAYYIQPFVLSKTLSQVYNNLGQSMFQLGNYDNAVAGSKAVLRLMTDTEVELEDEKIEALERMAKSFDKLNRRDAAITRINEAIDICQNTDKKSKLQQLKTEFQRTIQTQDSVGASYLDENNLTKDRERQKKIQSQHHKKKRRRYKKPDVITPVDNESNKQSEYNVAKSSLSTEAQSTEDLLSDTDSEVSNDYMDSDTYSFTTAPSTDNLSLFSYSQSDFDEDEILSTEDTAVPRETWYETSTRVLEGTDKKTKHCLQYDVDLKERFDFEENLPKWETFYPLMMTTVEMEHNIQLNPKKFRKCIINVDTSQSATCTTVDDPIGEQIRIEGRSKCGQTFTGDEVCVEIIGRANDRDCGKVVGIFQTERFNTKNPVFLCTITGEESHLMGPICKTVPKISIVHKKVLKRFPNVPNSKIEVYKMKNKLFQFSHFFNIIPDKRQQYIFVVVYLNWSAKFAYPKGMVIDVIKDYKDYRASLKILDNQFAIDPIYPSGVIHEVKGMKLDRKVPSNVFDVLTIDPKGSKDLDDALHITRLSEHIFQVGVHIADAAYFVEKGSEIDIEAERRATSFYPEDSRTIHMLPEPLSEDECSLREGEIRRTISVIFNLGVNGEVLAEPIIQRSFVRSMKQLSYNEAQLIINREDCGFSDIITGMITDLNTLAKSIRHSRLKNRLYHVQYNDDFLRDEPDMNETEAHNLVEEYMIMANCHIAKKISKQFPKGVLLRIQPPPDDRKLVEWFAQNQAVGNMILNLQDYSCQSSMGKMTLSLNDHSHGHLTVQKSVWGAVLKAKEDKKWNKLRNILCMDDIHPNHFIARIRWNEIMEPAEYRLCPGTSQSTASHHFSLDINLYTHFTSPLRRFVDLINHRFVHAYLDKRQAPYTTQELQMLSLRLSKRARQQNLYGKHSKTMKLAYRLQKHPAQINGFISQTDDDGVEIEIPKWPFLKGCKDIPFHLLDVCERPIVKETLTETSWRKRSYHTLGKPMDIVRSQNERREKLQLNPIKHCLYIPLEKWSRLLTNLISFTESDDKQHGKRCKKVVETIIDQIGLEGLNPMGTLYGTIDRVTCEGKRKEGISSLTDMCRFSFKFSPGRVLCTQLSTVFEKGLPKPKITVVKLADNVVFCLEHKEDPVACFTKESFESTKGRKWMEISGYVKAWTALVEMEAAVQSVQGGDTFFIEHVPICFTSPDSGSFTLNHSFCADRDVFGGIHIGKDEKAISMTDYVCIRKEVAQDTADPFIWIGHGQMVCCCKSEDYAESKELEIQFQLHGTQTCASSKMRDVLKIGEKDVCTLEIIPRSETDRRLKEVLRKKVIENNPLVKAIVLKKPIPKLDRDHLDLGNKIEKDLPLDELGKLNLPGNNVKQHEAIEKSLTSSFTLIQGPPGTGKTYTGIKLVYLFTKINKIIRQEDPAKKGGKTTESRTQVLYCGPSNKSVDVVARNLVKKLGNRCPKIVRVYGKTVVYGDFPVPGRATSSRAARKDGQCPEDLHHVALHHIIRQEGKPHAAEIRKYDVKFKKEIQTPGSQAITKHMIKVYDKLVQQAEEEEMKNYEAVLCTTAVGGSAKVMSRIKVFQCIIDECGMCTEPETLLPLIVAKPSQLVLIGDHKQLRPILLCSKAAKLGLEKSLFERYAEDAIFLNIQYRMHPDICSFPSKQFYGGKLETGPSKLWEIKQRLRIMGGKQIIFYHIEGEEEALTVHTDDGHERSKSNVQEVDKVVDLFRYMVRNEDINPRSINIMTQYKSQMSLIQKKIREYNFDITVNTVVASQGGEWDYVILSTVRSLPVYKIEPFPTRGWRTENLGFLADENQTNVALTRARKGLLIIGNKNVLKCDETWRSLLLHYEMHGCIQDANNIPSTEPPRAPIPIIGRYKSCKK